MILCPHCKKRPKQPHFNSKWCLTCAKSFQKRPKGTLNSAERSFAIKHRADMPFKEICKRLKASSSNVKRSCRGVRFCFKNGKYKENPSLVKQVIEYYSKHGKSETVKAFPNVNVKSIVDRPDYYGVKVKPRQIRWKENEIILAAKMAGLVDGKRQAKMFNRPNANEGSIRSLWMKRFKHGGGNIHGMSEWMAKHLLKPGYPVLKTRCWSRRKGVKGEGPMRGLVLWCDMDRHLLRGLPIYLKTAIKTMAEFQCWLFETKHPRQKILRLIKKAENI